MAAGYIDTSCLVAVALEEPNWTRLAETLERYDPWLASTLLEAEFQAALVREHVEHDTKSRALLGRFTWIAPDRRLTGEIDRALATGCVRGAGLWHLACALFVTPDPADLAFVTLDAGQAGVAGRLGFPGLPALLVDVPPAPLPSPSDRKPPTPEPDRRARSGRSRPEVREK